MTELPAMPPGAVVAAYLAPAPAGGLFPGVTLRLAPHETVRLPLAGRCCRAGRREKGPGYVAVYRLELDRTINSHGLIAQPGTVVYLRVYSAAEANAEAGRDYPAGHPLTLPQPQGGDITLAVRLGGKGIAAWDAGDPAATEETPERPGGGYPANRGLLRRAVGLRFLDPGYLGLCAPLCGRNFL